MRNSSLAEISPYHAMRGFLLVRCCIINKEKTSAENNKNNSDKTSVIHKAPLSVIAPKTKDTIDAITRINALPIGDFSQQSSQQRHPIPPE
ncbi:TPA: hypothetical protein JGA48_002655 [Salmonella enterica]|nr:hypothetical protein [Salmonella enterica]